MAAVKFLYGTQEKYDAIGTYDDDAFYKITDTGNVYIGARKISGPGEGDIGTSEIEDGSIKLEDLSPEVISSFEGGERADDDDIGQLF